MAIPEGYEKLAVIGIAWKGEYAAETAYKAMNAVHYQGSTYVALRDSPTGPPAADNVNWMYLAKGFVSAMLSEITAADSSGVLGQAGAEVGAQALMDAIADRVMTKLLARSAVTNNLLTTEEGFVLDARQGKELKTSIDAINRNLNGLKLSVSGTPDIDPVQGIKDAWPSLPDGVYCLKLSRGSVFGVFVMRTNNGDYGAVQIISYALATPLYLLKNLSGWNQ